MLFYSDVEPQSACLPDNRSRRIVMCLKIGF